MKLMKNIQADALYYGLSSLVEQLDGKSWSLIAGVERIDEPCFAIFAPSGRSMLFRLRNLEARSVLSFI
jgi:hypothetical protein